MFVRALITMLAADAVDRHMREQHYRERLAAEHTRAATAAQPAPPSAAAPPAAPRA